MFSNRRLDRLENAQQLLETNVYELEQIMFGHFGHPTLEAGVLQKVRELTEQVEALQNYLNVEHVPSTTKRVKPTCQVKGIEDV